MDRPLILDSSNINFCVYGMGTTGLSVCKYLHRNNFKKYKVWDDNKVLRAFYGFKTNKQKGEKLFSKHLDKVKIPEISPYSSITSVILFPVF